jgi:hypothetical protein
MTVVLLAARARDLSLGPEAASRLADLGVTYAALLADDEGVAVVLDGRRFDPARSVDAALGAIGCSDPGRALHPLAQLLLSDDPTS